MTKTASGLPLDYTGKAPGNLITDEAATTLMGPTMLYAPEYGAFFAESLVVKLPDGTPLTSGVDYWPSDVVETPSVFADKYICQVVYFDTSKFGTEYLITYQALGGDYGDHAAGATVVDQFYSTGLDGWPNQIMRVFRKPDEYNLNLDLHSQSTNLDLYTFENAEHAVDRVADAVSEGSRLYQVLIYDYLTEGLTALDLKSNTVLTQFRLHLNNNAAALVDPDNGVIENGRVYYGFGVVYPNHRKQDPWTDGFNKVRDITEVWLNPSSEGTFVNTSVSLSTSSPYHARWIQLIDRTSGQYSHFVTGGNPTPLPDGSDTVRTSVLSSPVGLRATKNITNDFELVYPQRMAMCTESIGGGNQTMTLGSLSTGRAVDTGRRLGLSAPLIRPICIDARPLPKPNSELLEYDWELGVGDTHRTGESADIADGVTTIKRLWTSGFCAQLNVVLAQSINNSRVSGLRIAGVDVSLDGVPPSLSPDGFGGSDWRLSVPMPVALKNLIEQNSTEILSEVKVTYSGTVEVLPTNTLYAQAIYDETGPAGEYKSTLLKLGGDADLLFTWSAVSLAWPLSGPQYRVSVPRSATSVVENVNFTTYKVERPLASYDLPLQKVNKKNTPYGWAMAGARCRVAASLTNHVTISRAFQDSAQSRSVGFGSPRSVGNRLDFSDPLPRVSAGVEVVALVHTTTSLGKRTLTLEVVDGPQRVQITEFRIGNLRLSVGLFTKKEFSYTDTKGRGVWVYSVSSDGEALWSSLDHYVSRISSFSVVAPQPWFRYYQAEPDQQFPTAEGSFGFGQRGVDQPDEVYSANIGDVTCLREYQSGGIYAGTEMWVSRVSSTGVGHDPSGWIAVGLFTTAGVGFMAARSSFTIRITDKHVIYTHVPDQSGGRAAFQSLYGRNPVGLRQFSFDKLSRDKCLLSFGVDNQLWLDNQLAEKTQGSGARLDRYRLVTSQLPASGQEAKLLRVNVDSGTGVPELTVDVLSDPYESAWMTLGIGNAVFARANAVAPDGVEVVVSAGALDWVRKLYNSPPYSTIRRFKFADVRTTNPGWDAFKPYPGGLPWLSQKVRITYPAFMVQKRKAGEIVPAWYYGYGVEAGSDLSAGKITLSTGDQLVSYVARYRSLKPVGPVAVYMTLESGSGQLYTSQVAINGLVTKLSDADGPPVVTKVPGGRTQFRFTFSKPELVLDMTELEGKVLTATARSPE